MRDALQDHVFPDYVVPQRHRNAAQAPAPVFENNRSSVAEHDELPAYAFAPRLTTEELRQREAAIKEMLEHQSDFLT